jgi:hypothetical protein
MKIPFRRRGVGVGCRELRDPPLKAEAFFPLPRGDFQESMMAITAGTHFGRYEIRSLLGAGGMGEVYRARDPKLNRDVAIKVLPAAFSADPERLRRFEQEAQAAGALEPPKYPGDL